jgi:hypothetical protein
MVIKNVVRDSARAILRGKCDKFEAMKSLQGDEYQCTEYGVFWDGVNLGKRLEGDPQRWKVLADFWVQTLVYVAPSGNMEEHIR